MKKKHLTKWILDDDYIILMPDLKIKIPVLKGVTMLGKIIGFLAIALIGSGVLLKDNQLFSSMGIIFSFAFFLINLQLGKVAREAASVKQEREAELNRAIENKKVL